MKNRNFTILIILSIILITPSPLFSGNLGDVNEDNQVSILDSLLIAQFYVGLAPSGFDAELADVDCSGSPDIIDALLVAKLYVGLLESFTCSGTEIIPEPESSFIPKTGPFEEDYIPKKASPHQSGKGFPLTEAGAKISIKVKADKITRLIPPALMGHNLGVWIGDKYFKNPEFKDRIKTIKLPLCRFPGGSLSDKYHWNGEYPAYAVSQAWDGKSKPWAVDTKEFLQFMEEMNSAPLITVNHGYHQYDTELHNGNVQNAARLAADWVEYCNSPNDGKNPNGGIDYAAKRAEDGFPEPFIVKYWEIGNEVYGAWEMGHEKDGAEYGKNFNVIYDAMKAVDPSIYIGICGYAGDEAKRAWTEAVLGYPGTAERFDFIDIHDYFFYTGSGAVITEEDCLKLSEQLETNKKDLDNVILKVTKRRPEKVPYYLGEFNMTNPENKHSTQLVAGLFVAKCLGQLIDLDYSAASLWVMANASREGDHGFMTRNGAVPDYTPHSFYYPYFFFTQNYGDKQLESSSSDPEVLVFASRFSSGEIALVIINESPFNKTADIDFSGFTTKGAVNAWILTADTLSSQTCRLNEQANGLEVGGPVVSDVPPYDWNVGETKSIKVNIEKYSVTSLVIY